MGTCERIWLIECILCYSRPHGVILSDLNFNTSLFKRGNHTLHWIRPEGVWLVGQNRLFHTVQRLMLSKGAKRTKFYHITVILQYCWDKTIARSGYMYSEDSGILRFVIKCFGITNTSVKYFAIPISSVKSLPKCLRKLKVVWTNLI